MRTVFFGSDDFAAAHLRGLIDAQVEVAGCVTQPDRPKGRGMKMHVSPIKEVAADRGIPVLQPDSLKDTEFLAQLKGLSADIFVVIAFGRFLPVELLEMPVRGAVNLHPSLLPRYRGAAPINWAIINGDTVTGISIIRLNSQMDAGDVIGQTQLPIRPEDTAVTLRERMIPVGSALLLETLAALEVGTCSCRPQDPAAATLAPKLQKADGKVDWIRMTAVEIHNRVRGLLPWPTAYTTYQGKTVKLLATEPQDVSGEPGLITTVDREALTVAAGSGAVRILRVHPESGKAMSASEFIRGYHIRAGQQLGD